MSWSLSTSSEYEVEAYRNTPKNIIVMMKVQGEIFWDFFDEDSNGNGKSWGINCGVEGVFRYAPAGFGWNGF